MLPKEMIMVGAGAFLLTNTTIVATLYFAGHFDADSPPEAVPENPPQEAPPAPGEAQPRVRGLRTMSEAMNICEDKFLASTATVNKSYEIKYTENYFSEQEELYKIFIEYETVSKVDTPSERLSAVCEVSAPQRKIVAYKEFPM